MASYVLSFVVTPASMQNVLPRPSGSSLKPVIIIVAALLISAAVFFLFTKKRIAANRQAPPTTVVAAPAEAPQPTRLTPPPEPLTPPAPAAPPKAATPFGFARPLDLGTQIARSLAMGELGDVAKMGSSDATSEAAATVVLEKIFKGMGYKVGPEDTVVVMGQIGDATRLSIPLIKPGETQPSLSIQVDAMRDPKTGWKVAQFRLPKELQGAVAAMLPAAEPVPNAPATVAPRGMAAAKSPLFTVDDTPDALGTASEFVAALLKQDFNAARKFTDESKVPAEKLAALCIVFEEGGYALKPAKPLVMTVASPTVSWVIAQIQSEKLQAETEFGVEMQRPLEDKPWAIVGLNLSDLLGSFSKAANKMGVPYTPIVNNPRGGESLALYFEYDKATLHPRAEKQLGIVASLLKANSDRKLRITGHTDAKGADDYNVQLSRARAQTVKEQLAQLGVSPDQVVTEGMGKAAPLSPNTKADGSDDPEGRSRNRRAEIFLDF